MDQLTVCLWYEGEAEQAARFYAETFPNAEVRSINRAPADYPDPEQGDVLTVEAAIAG